MSKIKYILLLVTAYVLIALWRLPDFVLSQFGEMNLDQILFILFGNNKGANVDIVWDFISTLAYDVLIVTVLFVVIIFALDVLKHYEFQLNYKFFKLNNKKKIEFSFGYRHVFILVSIILVSLTMYYDKKYSVVAYFKHQKNVGSFYEDYYINPSEIEVKFPEVKKNLIYIVVESLNTNFSSMMIDNKEVNLIPNLESIVNDNVGFTMDSGLSGHINTRGTTWTMGGLVAQTSGVPLSGPMEGNSYGIDGKFLPGLISIGNILKDNGYDNYFSIGSLAEFAGRDTFFKTHGEYEIFDLESWKEESRIPDDYHVFWGMEDRKLLEFSKDKLLEISKKGKPFNFTLLTVDTHFMDGYVDEYCELPYTSQYANAIQCSDTILSSFVDWVQEQEFYENTTIVLVADHTTMNTEFIKKSLIKENRLYNAFINLDFTVEDSILMNREFTTMDLFPTTLAALNVDVSGERLGLGTNMFSGKPSLLEELGYNALDEGLSMRSNFYNKNFHRTKKD